MQLDAVIHCPCCCGVALLALDSGVALLAAIGLARGRAVVVPQLVEARLEVLEWRCSLQARIPLRVQPDAVRLGPHRRREALLALDRRVALAPARLRTVVVLQTVQVLLEGREGRAGSHARVPVGVRDDADFHGPLRCCVALLAEDGRVALLRGLARLGAVVLPLGVEVRLKGLEGRGGGEVAVPVRVQSDAVLHGPLHGRVALLALHGRVALRIGNYRCLATEIVAHGTLRQGKQQHASELASHGANLVRLVGEQIAVFQYAE
mmetsp:Transcript_88943/g.229459  ORF Transcript_88943/g.229459 Transcript_88943/m.229459 type:complete len:264 (-) Transcript_88943:2-793(-)